MADLPRPVTIMIWSHPAAIASSTPYWMMGLSTSGSISLGCALVAGRKRVPRPAAGKTAFRTLFIFRSACDIVRCRKRAVEVIHSPAILNYRCLKDGRVVAHHVFADVLDRHEAVLHELVVEVLKRELVAHLLLVIFTQLHDLQLAERIDKVRWVGGAALGLAAADA